MPIRSTRDMDHSDDPKDWVTFQDVALAFPGVPFVVASSRNHMKQKKEKVQDPDSMSIL